MEHREQQQHQDEVHVVSYGRYFLIWLGLLALTGITVAFAGLDMGNWIIITAMTIASIKTLLVVNVFMHLKYEDRIFRIFVLVAMAILLIFIVFTFFDYAFR